MASDNITPGAGIAEKYQKTWRALIKLGAKPTDMAKFELYLASDAPMTDEIMVAGVRALGQLPQYKKERPEYNALTNHIMDKLHERFAKSGDAAEKEKIFWVVRSGYLAVYSKGLNMEFEEMLGGRSQDSLPDFNDRTDKAIKRCLEKHNPKKGHLLALISTAVNNEIVNVYRKVYGGSGSVARRNFAAPVSLDTGGLDGGSMEETLPIYNISVLDGLVAREERAAREGKLDSIRRLQPEDAGIAPQQAKFLAHYQRQSDDIPFPSTKALAAELGVSEGTVKTHNSRTFQKLVEHFNPDGGVTLSRRPKATHASNGHSNGSTRIKSKPVSYETIADQYPTLDNQTTLSPSERGLITACHTLRESGAELSPYNVSRQMGVSVASARSYKHLVVKKLGLSEPETAKEGSFQAREAARAGTDNSAAHNR